MPRKIAGPKIDYTVYVYVYIYIYLSLSLSLSFSLPLCAVESKAGPRFAFFCQKLVQVFLFVSFVLVFEKSSSFCREKERKHKKGSRLTIFRSHKLVNYVAQHAWTSFWLRLGPIVDSGDLTFAGHFWLLQTMTKPLFLQCFQQSAFLSPPQKLRNTVCEHNRANWTKMFLFRQFSLFESLLCPVFAFLWEEWKIKTNKQKRNKTTRCKQENHLVLLQKGKRTTQT